MNNRSATIHCSKCTATISAPITILNHEMDKENWHFEDGEHICGSCIRICQIEHTEYQPAKWECPVCQGGYDKLVVGDSNNALCEKLHKDDLVRCYGCNKLWTGNVLAEAMKEAQKVTTIASEVV